VEKGREIEEAIRLRTPLKAACVAGDPELDWKCLTCQYWRKCSGKPVSFRVEFPQPLMAGKAYEGALLREALHAGEAGCDVKLHRNQFGEIIAVEASGDEVKLVPLRRVAEEVRTRVGGKRE